MLEKFIKSGINKPKIEQLERDIKTLVNDGISATRKLVRKVVPVLVVPAAVLASGGTSGCTLDTMGTGASNQTDAACDVMESDSSITGDAGDEDAGSDSAVQPDHVNCDVTPDTVLDVTEEFDVQADVPVDTVSEDTGEEADVQTDVQIDVPVDTVSEDATHEPDVQVDAPADVIVEDANHEHDAQPVVGSIGWSSTMDGFTVLHMRGGTPQVSSSSPNVAACQQTPFTSVDVQTGDYIELFVKENTVNDGGACSVDGGTGLDCENIAAAMFIPVNITPAFVEGRCAKYGSDCPDYAGIIPEINDPSGYITLPYTQGGGVWTYSVPQSCTAKVYKLHF